MISDLPRPVRSVATYLYAINQSRAKMVFDPIYGAAAAALLRGHPPSRELAAKAYPEILFLGYRARARKVAYWVEDWDFAEARPELLTPRQRAAMHTMALGETSGFAVSDGFLRAFRAIPDLAAFFGVWFVEELNHYLGHHRYLETMGEGWPASGTEKVAKVEFLPYADDPMEIAACNLYQELLGYLFYRSFAKQARDPFLAAMIAQFAKDELRHYKYYQDVIGRHLQREPGFRKNVLRTFLKATTPFNQVSGGPRQVIEHQRRAAFYFRKAEFAYFCDQLEFLLGKRFEEIFTFYFRGHLPPCGTCGQELYQCACAEYEPQVPRREAERAPAIARSKRPSRRSGALTTRLSGATTLPS